MNGLNSQLSLEIFNGIDLYGDAIDSSYDYIIENMLTNNTNYKKEFAKSLFYNVLGNLTTFEDDLGNNIERGLELRLYDVESETTPVLTLKTELGHEKFEFDETERSYIVRCKMVKQFPYFEDVNPAEEFTSLSDPATIVLSNYPVKNSVTISYYINGNTGSTPDGTLSDINVEVGTENSVIHLDVSSDNNIDLCSIDYTNKTITINFNDTNVTSVDKVVVNYKKPIPLIDYYIYKAELYVIMKKNSSAYTFNPPEDSYGTIERKIIEIPDLSNYSFVQTKASKTTLPNKGIRLTFDFTENDNGYVKQTLNLRSEFSFVFDKNVFK